MDQMNYAAPMQITVKPDKEERRQIRKKYNLAALVIIINMVLFNVLGRGVIIIVCMAFGGGFNFEAYREGAKILMEHELLRTLLSCMPPIISEVTAILIGIKIFKINIKDLSSNREGYGGGTVAKLITLCLGLQLAASFIAAIIQAVLNKFGLNGETVDLSATTSFSANIILSFYACLLGPVLEELLYRGVLLQSMRKYSERFAIFLSALIFGLMHQNYQQFILGFLLGIPLAMITIKYNSLIPSIFTHIFVNTTGMLSTYLLQYACPELYEAAISGDTPDLAALTGTGMISMILIVLFRFGFLIAALIVGIISLAKGGNMKRPTPAGKSRALPILVTSIPWWIVFAAYIYLAFVSPFLG